MNSLQTMMDTAQTWLMTNISNVVIAFLVLILGFTLAKRFTKSLGKVLVKRGVDKAASSFIENITFVTLMIVALIIALSHLGFQTSSLIAILGAAGLAIGLALKDSLSNIASGVMLISVKPFKSGDFVEVSGVAGTVEKIEIFSTTLKTPDNKVIVIPNATITAETITNYSKESTRRIDLVIGISYESDLLKAKTILQHMLEQHPKVLPDPEPLVAVAALADSSVNFNVRPWVDKADYWPVHNELLETIKLRFDQEGIDIPYPQMAVHMKKEN
jgi:small conductance mechanosensitive channel